MNINPKTYLQQWADRYKHDLTETSCPFGWSMGSTASTEASTPA